MDDDFIPMFNVVDFAQQILNMNSLIIRQKAELERLKDYEKKYNTLLNDSLSHSKAMVGNIVKTLMVPGVAEAFAANAKPEAFTNSGGRPDPDGPGYIDDHESDSLLDGHPKYDQLISSKDLIINTGRDDEPVLSAQEKEMYEEIRFDQEARKNPDILL
jgi:hypothetical protein